MPEPITRRDALLLAGLACAVGANDVSANPPAREAENARPFLTPGKDFRDVSRGKPVPHTLKGDALVQARLTPESWRLEILAENGGSVEKPLRISNGTALDYKGLLALGSKHSIRFLKAMQCNNIARPLGQGLWEGVPLRNVLEACGKISCRRLFYWGFHNDIPAQMFRSSLAINQVLDTPPGEMPPFLAYKLNGGPVPLQRGGPVRMVVPWAHGFKSIKWLQQIRLTNKYEANDTYAQYGNHPESYLKTAAYFEDGSLGPFPAGGPVVIHGTAMVGWPGLERVEYWLRAGVWAGPLAEDDPAWTKAEWKPGAIDPPPTDWGGGLPKGVLPRDVWGFTPDGKPKEWPMRFSIAHWTVTLRGLKPGKYELRVRTVDKNGFAQPQPRPGQLSGKNRIEWRVFEVTGAK
jgi:DMSO/TMAO reductase YedYZ molybdopterin-dependent catalytic subunit